LGALVAEPQTIDRVFPEWWPEGAAIDADSLRVRDGAHGSGSDGAVPDAATAAPVGTSDSRREHRSSLQPAESVPDAPRWKSKSSRNRRGFTIHAYIGANGHGKSLAMMHDTKLSMDHARPILSTVRVLDPSKPWNSITGHPAYEGYTPLRTWDQLLEFSGGDVLFDEVLGIAASESGRALPKPVQLLLNQLRRRDILLRWTAPSWSRANIVLREVTQAVTVCRGYLPKYENRGDESRMWGMNRLFRWTTYDAMEFTTWSDAKESKLTGKANAWLWRPGSWAERSYDTFDSVDNVDSGEGYCFRCGGERAKKKLDPCSCATVKTPTL
jgi:hypothetical protein